MKEKFELRIVEEFASRLFDPNEGKRLGSGIVRLVSLASDDPRLEEVAVLQKEIDSKYGRAFFHGWEIIRKYSKREIEVASLFHLRITSTFEPAGEECGTIYNESVACPRCGAGAKQVGPLFLNLNRIPKGKDFARTIAGEVIISRRASELFKEIGVSGVSFHPAREKGAKNLELLDWNQLIIQSNDAEICPPTRIGIDPFNDDEKGENRCSEGDTAGLNLLSEVSISSAPRVELDVFASRQFVGVRRGLVRPERIILISQKVRRLIDSERFKGCGIDVAHLV